MNYEQRVSTRADVRALYEKVIGDPRIERYRGYTDTGSYAWDALAGEYIKRQGVVWFENPSYRGEAPFEEAAAEDREETAAFFDAQEVAVSREEELEEAVFQLTVERDEARKALLELRDALALVMRLAAAK